MLEGVLISISTDIIPNLVNPKAHASAQMMQSIIQGIRQLLPVYDQYLAEEHNQMMELLRDVAAQLDATPGDAADRIRDRAATLGTGDQLPIPLGRDTVMAAHRELGVAVQDTMIDLDELQARRQHRRRRRPRTHPRAHGSADHPRRADVPRRRRTARSRLTLAPGPLGTGPGGPWRSVGLAGVDRFVGEGGELHRVERHHQVRLGLDDHAVG